MASTIWRLEFLTSCAPIQRLPADLKAVLDYQEGRTQIDEATKTGDLVRRRDLLEQARSKLEASSRPSPNIRWPVKPWSRRADAGRAWPPGAALGGRCAEDPSQKAAQQGRGPTSFTQAREAFAHAGRAARPVA